MKRTGHARGRRRRGRLLAALRLQRGGARHAGARPSSGRPEAPGAGRRDLARRRRLRVRHARALPPRARRARARHRRHDRRCSAAGSTPIRSCRSRTRSPRTIAAGFVAFTGRQRRALPGDRRRFPRHQRRPASTRPPQRGLQRGADQAEPGRHGHRDAGRARRRPKAAGFGTIVSARSGETEDVTIVHLAVGWDAGQLKVGSFARSERMAKWNEVLRIEEALGGDAVFAGWSALPRMMVAKPV